MQELENNLTITEFAKRLGVSVPTIRNYIKDGKIEPTMKVGTHLYFSESSISKYVGIFSGKKRGNLDTASCVAVLYVSSESNQTIPEEAIESAMQQKGIISLGACDLDRELQPDEVEGFTKYCAEKNFNVTLREIVNKCRDKERDKAIEDTRIELYKKQRNIKNQPTYIDCMKRLGSTAININDRLRLEEYKANEDKKLENSEKEAKIKEHERIEEIEKSYSSQYVDDSGNIVPDAPKDYGVDYVRCYKNLQKKYLSAYRIKTFNSISKYTVFSIAKDDVSTYEIPFKNIINRAYDKVYVINMSKLSVDWQNVLNIIHQSGVSVVEELILEQ